MVGRDELEGRRTLRLSEGRLGRGITVEGIEGRDGIDGRVTIPGRLLPEELPEEDGGRTEGMEGREGMLGRVTVPPGRLLGEELPDGGRTEGMEGREGMLGRAEGMLGRWGLLLGLTEGVEGRCGIEGRLEEGMDGRDDEGREELDGRSRSRRVSRESAWLTKGIPTTESARKAAPRPRRLREKLGFITLYLTHHLRPYSFMG